MGASFRVMRRYSCFKGFWRIPLTAYIGPRKSITPQTELEGKGTGGIRSPKHLTILYILFPSMLALVVNLAACMAKESFGLRYRMSHNSDSIAEGSGKSEYFP